MLFIVVQAGYVLLSVLMIIHDILIFSVDSFIFIRSVLVEFSDYFSGVLK